MVQEARSIGSNPTINQNINNTDTNRSAIVTKVAIGAILTIAALVILPFPYSFFASAIITIVIINSLIEETLPYEQRTFFWWWNPHWDTHPVQVVVPRRSWWFFSPSIPIRESSARVPTGTGQVTRPYVDQRRSERIPTGTGAPTFVRREPPAYSSVNYPPPPAYIPPPERILTRESVRVPVRESRRA